MIGVSQAPRKDSLREEGRKGRRKEERERGRKEGRDVWRGAEGHICCFLQRIWSYLEIAASDFKPPEIPNLQATSG